jgi:hypothetical protein
MTSRCVAVFGLAINFVGCLLLFIDSLRTSSAITEEGPRLGFEAHWQWRGFRYFARVGFLLLSVGMFLQGLALYL